MVEMGEDTSTSSMPVSPELRQALDDARRLGMIGPSPIDEVIEHARRFLPALADVAGRVIDLGSGGGVPGLVIAHDRPDLHVTLLDRRSKRTDFLSRVVRRLGWNERVEVLATDASTLVVVEDDRYDGAVARGFGPPFETLRLAVGITRPGGVVVISEPPDGDRWTECPLLADGTVRRDEATTGVVRFTVLAR
jgi:16S rRNA (guanine527-N7)-methyltransferase